MPTLEDKDQNLETKPNGSHDDVKLSAKEQAEFDQIEAGAEDSFYKDGNKNSEKKGGGAVDAALKTTPAGRIVSFLRSRKGVTGSAIFSVIILVGIFIASIATPATGFLAVANMLDDFSFGPGNRSTLRVANRVFRNIDTIRNAGNNTELQQRANRVPADIDTVRNINGEKVARVQRRFNFRSMVLQRSPRANWRGVFGRATSGGDTASRRMTRTSPDRQRAGPLRGVENVASESDIDNARNSDNPRQAARNIGSNYVRNTGSVALLTTAMGCVLSAVEDAVPDERELYEQILEYQADLYASKSQLADGETADPDQVADMWEFLIQTEEGVDVPDDFDRDLSEAERQQLQEIQNRFAELQADEDVDDPEQIIRDEFGQDLAIGGVQFETTTIVRSFANSAHYKYAARHEVTGGEPDFGITFSGIQDATNSGWSGVALTSGSIINSIPGAQVGCSAAGSPVGSILIIGVDYFVSAKACLATLGAGCGVRAGARVAMGEVASRLIMWGLLQLMYDAIVPEGPEELMGFIGMGSNMAQSEHERNLGAPPMSNAETNQRREITYRDMGEGDRAQGFAWRYLSPQNHRSVVAQLALQTHFLQPNALISPFTNILSTLTRPFYALTDRVVAREEFNNYEIRQFGFQDELLDRFTSPDNIDALIENDIEISQLEGYGCAPDEAEGWIDNFGNRCNVGMWNDALLMDVIIDECISNFYPQHLEEDWTYEYEQYTSSTDDEGRIAVTPRSPSPEIDCSDNDGGLSDRERDMWERVGMWRYANKTMENIECLSNNDPC